MGDFKHNYINVAKAGELQAEAVKLMDRAVIVDSRQQNGVTRVDCQRWRSVCCELNAAP